MLITITDEQKIKVTVAPKTAAGNDATIDGAVNFSKIEGDATIEPIEGEPNSAYLVSGAEGNSVIEVSADADLGEGVNTITDRIDLAVVPAAASALGITAGEAELK